MIIHKANKSKPSDFFFFGCRQSAECLVTTSFRIAPKVKAMLHVMGLPSGDSSRSEAGILLRATQPVTLILIKWDYSQAGSTCSHLCRILRLCAICLKATSNSTALSSKKWRWEAVRQEIKHSQKLKHLNGELEKRVRNACVSVLAASCYSKYLMHIMGKKQNTDDNDKCRHLIFQHKRPPVSLVEGNNVR